MTSLLSTRPDVDFTDGTFYADGGAREAYRWMRANQPVFRDRNGLAAAASYQSVLDAERNPELFSNTGGIRPETPAMPYMIDMDDPAHVLRRKLVNSGFTRKRVMDKVPSIETLCDTLIDNVCERGECDGQCEATRLLAKGLGLSGHVPSSALPAPRWRAMQRTQ